MGEEKLFECAEHGNVEAMNEAIAAGACVDAVNGDGYTPLMLAAMNGHAHAVQQLLDSGANIYNTDNVGHTPLILAAQKCQTETVRILLRQAARMKQRTTPSVVALYAANSLEMTGCHDVAHMLRTNPS